MVDYLPWKEEAVGSSPAFPTNGYKNDGSVTNQNA